MLLPSQGQAIGFLTLLNFQSNAIFQKYNGYMDI